MPVSSAAAAAGACCLRRDAMQPVRFTRTRAPIARFARNRRHLFLVGCTTRAPPSGRALNRLAIGWGKFPGSSRIPGDISQLGRGLASLSQALAQSVTRLAIECGDSREFENSLFDSQSRDIASHVAPERRLRDGMACF